MRWHTKKFCELIFQLDRIPRYGRLYKVGRDSEGLMLHRRQWRWQRHGRWGMHLLMDMGLFWRYMDAMQPYVKEEKDEQDPA